MIRISDKSLCCGCSACVNVCPVQCIVMRRDREGFDYPVANPDRCVGCGRCEEICPVHSLVTGSRDGHVSVQENDDIRKYADQVILENGFVYASVYESDGTAGYAEAGSPDEMEGMTFAGNVQSDSYGTFEEVKYRLEEGASVLYCCPPCQAAGLRSFLGKQYERLVTISGPCKGVGSPEVWKKLQAYGSAASGEGSDIYDRLVLQSLMIRPSCLSCPLRTDRNDDSPDEKFLEKRAEFFRGYHSAPEIIPFMKKYVDRNPFKSFLTMLGLR